MKRLKKIIFKIFNRSFFELKRLPALILIWFKWRQDQSSFGYAQELRSVYFNLNLNYFLQLGSFPNLNNPRTLDDIINWAKLFDQSKLVMECCDKLRVRDYVARTAGEQYLLDVFQISDDGSDFDFGALPERFVIKTNHDSGSVYLVKNKNKVDFAKILGRFRQNIKIPFGWEQGEWPYSYIRPKIFIEEYFNDGLLDDPADYKIQCVNGKAWFVRYTFNRGKDGGKGEEIVLDAKGNRQNFIIGNGFLPSRHQWKKPQNWSEMIVLAELLSKPFQLARVDLFASESRVVVGEITFFPFAGVHTHHDTDNVMQLRPRPHSLIRRAPIVAYAEATNPRKSTYPGKSLIQRLMD